MDITLEHISKTFDKKKWVIDDLSVTFKDGNLTTLLGFSGCGKTTLLRLISGLDTPDKGRILFGDKVVFDKEKKIDLAPKKRGAAFVFQDFALWPNMTAEKNVAYAVSSSIPYPKPGKDFVEESKKRKQEIKERTQKALSMVKMEDYAKHLPGELSGGQKQRVAIARAIAIEPKVILFDEPLSALDALLREQMRGEIRELVKKLKTTALFVTHDQEEAMAISDRIIVLSGGKIVENEVPETIYWHPRTKFVANFIGKASWLDEKTYLRPEDIFLEPIEDSQKASVKVTSCQNKGGYYLSEAKDEKTTYTFRSEKKLPIGENINLYYKQENLRHIESI